MRKPFIIANWKMNKNVHESVAFVKAIKEKVKWISDVTVYPGEDELLALAQGAIRVLNGEEDVKEY